MATTDHAMQSLAARHHTFEIPHPLSKRRASSQSSRKKGAGNTLEWPHQNPTVESLARAGFFYRPAQESHDNVQCFFCSVKLDGWELDDDPLKEHLAHSPNCHWAVSLDAGISAQQRNDIRDPMSPELAVARKGTFEAGAGWPHESKRGWKCKIAKMVDAGWCLDPSQMGEDGDADGTTCFYCNLSLDGWEPKDEPLEEHRRRSPECAFFLLKERFAVPAITGKKGKGRASTASKASRLSAQSAISTVSEASSLINVGDGADLDMDAAADDTVLTTVSQSASKPKKKAPRAKAAAKGVKGRKRTNTVESAPEPPGLYLDYAVQTDAQPLEDEIVVSFHSPEVEASAKKTRKGTRQSKQAVDSSVVESSSTNVVPQSQKATRTRKAKTQVEPASEVQAQQQEAQRISSVSQDSVQLQEDLERSIDLGDGDVLGESTPQAEPARPERGVKRTSDGTQKHQEEAVEVSKVVVEFPVPPAAKATGGRKASEQISAATVETGQMGIQTADSERLAGPPGQDLSAPSVDPIKAAKPKKATAKKGRKASSTRSSKASLASYQAACVLHEPEVEDLARDELEIEAELQRIATEQAQQAIALEQEKTAEFEPSPSHTERHINEIKNLEEELRAEVQEMTRPGQMLAEYVDRVAHSPSSTKHDQAQQEQKTIATPSPSGSDKENRPSTIPQQEKLTTTTATITDTTSPSKTTRIPLAPGTPNRQPHSPSKHQQPKLLSPSKSTTLLAPLTSTHPWLPLDLDALLLQPPTRLSTGSTFAALSTPERQLTVEEWVRLHAEKGEAELRRRCEEAVAVFEREGLKGLECLGGVAEVFRPQKRVLQG